jgi:hypothetical protein
VLIFEDPLKEFEIGVLRKIIRAEMEAVTEGKRRIHVEKLHNVSCLLYFIFSTGTTAQRGPEPPNFLGF